jgi:hypothetical protein
MTLEEYMNDLDHWVDLEWEDVERDYPGLLLVGMLAEKIVPTECPEEGPLYSFTVDGSLYSWANGDGWDVNDAERLLNVVASTVFDAVAEDKDAAPSSLPTDPTVPVDVESMSPTTPAKDD